MPPPWHRSSAVFSKFLANLTLEGSLLTFQAIRQHWVLRGRQQMVPAASSEGVPGSASFFGIPDGWGHTCYIYSAPTACFLSSPTSERSLESKSTHVWECPPHPHGGQTPSCVLISTASALVEVKVEWGRPAEARWFENRRFEG